MTAPNSAIAWFTVSLYFVGEALWPVRGFGAARFTREFGTVLFLRLLWLGVEIRIDRSVALAEPAKRDA